MKKTASTARSQRICSQFVPKWRCYTLSYERTLIKKFLKSLKTSNFRNFYGAADQIRTGDLILTKDALYRLSYSSMATRNGLEPSTSSVTGWRSKPTELPGQKLVHHSIRLAKCQDKKEKNLSFVQSGLLWNRRTSPVRGWRKERPMQWSACADCSSSPERAEDSGEA